jgi:hypothetical protein
VPDGIPGDRAGDSHCGQGDGEAADSEAVASGEDGAQRVRVGRARVRSVDQVGKRQLGIVELKFVHILTKPPWPPIA